MAVPQPVAPDDDDRVADAAPADLELVDAVVVEVEDNGPGIPAEERQRVLERFYRVPGTGQEGSGLGLSIVNAVAERHSGKMSLHDGADGGLLVRMDFPTSTTA